ncbi:MAG: hypothetical protein BGO01_01395 [Armatimonadetes bacterium 55-13]|mgnify:FL=1|nr:hypothetical protein [Armatimonadota bacterium]OJU65603.1 MAG: hypothetical protein BGO01_01395 [Armatimonadetes bacterium 55-13]
MSQVDWQAYLDGSLSPEDRAAADRLLDTSPDAQEQLAGLRVFIASVREAGRSEEVPLARLEALVPTIRPPWWRRGAWLTASAVAAILVLAIYLRPSAPNATLSDRLVTNDPVVAAQWVQSSMPFRVPTIDLGPSMPLKLIHHTDKSCCFDYLVHGKIYHVNVYEKGERRGSGREIKLKCGTTAYVGHGVHWEQNDLAFYVIGPDESTSVEVATLASSQLNRA